MIYIVVLQSIHIIENNNRIEFIMTTVQSKLMLQLAKQQRNQQRSFFNQQHIEDIYNTICKLEPKNLMLLQFLCFVVEKDFIRNSHKIVHFVEMYDQVAGKIVERDQSSQQNEIEIEEQKFNKKKFIKLLKQISKKVYPGYHNAYETILYQKITKPMDNDQHRIKIDDAVKKILTRQVIVDINQYNTELQGLFQIFMPENYNQGLDFSWQEIKLLQKRLPIICLLRILHEAELVPQFMTPGHFMQLIVKLKPPSLPNSSNSNSKQVMFYTSQTMNGYIRDYASQQNIRLSEGDVGLTFFEFQLALVKIANEFCKDSKTDIVQNIKKLFTFMKIREAFDLGAMSSSRLMQSVRRHLTNQNQKTEKIHVPKAESTTNIQELYDGREEQVKDSQSINSVIVTGRDLDLIKKDLDNDLGELSLKKKIDKQNDGMFDVDKKHIVIGEQLPKIQQKNKPAPPKQTKKLKLQDMLMGYKPQLQKPKNDQPCGGLIQQPKKLRINKEFPVILNEVFYPSHLSGKLSINAKSELYLETSYINLGERLYQDAYHNYNSAKKFIQPKSVYSEFYFKMHAAQIFDSAGRDEIALDFYHKSKELLLNLPSAQGFVRAAPYIGMGASLFHMQQYQYALRCFQKAKTVYGINLQGESVDNAILQNNIGCCLMMINRNQQAIKYFQISHCVLDLKAGCFDERTLVVQQNLNKNKKAFLEMLPQFKTMWKTYVQKSTGKLPAVKTANKKK